MNIGIFYVSLVLEESICIMSFVIYFSAERGQTHFSTLFSFCIWTCKLFMTLAGWLTIVGDKTCSVSLSMTVTVTDGRIRQSGGTLSYTSSDSKRRVKLYI
jgi:hypothetical protein